MLKRIVKELLLSLLSLLSLLFLPPMICMAQSPQYTQVYSNPMTDITSNIKGGLNAWVSTSGTCQLKTGVVDPAGNYWCISPDTYVYELADGSASFVKQTAMGTGVKALAILGDGNIFALMSGSLCTSQAPDLQVFEWNSAGSSWTAKAAVVYRMELHQHVGICLGMRDQQRWWPLRIIVHQSSN